MGRNPPQGAVVNFYVKDVTDSTKATVSILDKDKALVRQYSSDSKEAGSKLEVNKGMNQFVWDLRYPEVERMDGMILWNGMPGSIIAPPGNYTARVKVGKDSVDLPFSIKPDPNYAATQQDYEAQYTFLKQVRDKFNETQKAIKDIRACAPRSMLSLRCREKICLQK